MFPIQRRTNPAVDFGPFIKTWIQGRSQLEEAQKKLSFATDHPKLWAQDRSRNRKEGEWKPTIRYCCCGDRNSASCQLESGNRIRLLRTYQNYRSAQYRSSEQFFTCQSSILLVQPMLISRHTAATSQSMCLQIHGPWRACTCPCWAARSNPRKI